MNVCLRVRVRVCMNDVNCLLLFLLLSIFVGVVVQRPHLIQITHFVRLLFSNSIASISVCVRASARACVCARSVFEGRKNEIDYNGTS